MVNRQADDSEEVLRISLDAKVDVKMGNFSRGGKNRKHTKAADHDFGSGGKLTPVGIFTPKNKDLWLYMVKSKTTSDCYVDIIEKWWEDNSGDIKNNTKKLVINLDNGPQQNSRRTQFMMRLQNFSDKVGLAVDLAYYPPYHSKYNPVERPFSALEKHWSGEILSDEDSIVGFAQTMEWAGKRPKVEVINTEYKHGIKLTKKEMNKLDKGFKRKAGIEKWFVQITPRAG